MAAVTPVAIERVVAEGESEKVEFKKSTGQLNRAGQTLCAFLNDDGGRVIIGITDNGKVVGQEVSDHTRRDIAAMLDRFEPPAPLDVQFVDLPDRNTKLIVINARPQDEARPFTFDGRPYQRVQTTTSVMPQERYETMLLDRAHARRRWENQPAVDVGLDDLDHEDILRTRETAIAQRRISAGTSTEIGDILDRLGLRRRGVITQAAQILYGTRFLPDYPQGLSRWAGSGAPRSRATSSTTVRSTCTLSRLFEKASRSSIGRCRWQPTSRKANCYEKIGCRFLPPRSGRSCSMRSCTATTCHDTPRLAANRPGKSASDSLS
jgi:predicted HTH transcriptional regulator